MPLTPEGRHRLHALHLVEGRQIITARAAEPIVYSPWQIWQLRGTLRQANCVVRGRAPTESSASKGPGGSPPLADPCPLPARLWAPANCKRGSVGELSVSTAPVFGADIVADQLGGHYR